MSQEENVEVVRQRVSVRTRARRGLAEDLVRFPRFVALLARLVWGLYVRLSPHSKLRQAIIRSLVTRCFEGFNRGDLRVGFALFHPHVETLWPTEISSLGFHRTRGIDERIAGQKSWMDEWGRFSLFPEELVAVGDDRVVVLGRQATSGASSGAEVSTENAYVLTISEGRVIREEIFFANAEALEVVGLSE